MSTLINSDGWDDYREEMEAILDIAGYKLFTKFNIVEGPIFEDISSCMIKISAEGFEYGPINLNYGILDNPMEIVGLHINYLQECVNNIYRAKRGEKPKLRMNIRPELREKYEEYLKWAVENNGNINVPELVAGIVSSNISDEELETLGRNLSDYRYGYMLVGHIYAEVCGCLLDQGEFTRVCLSHQQVQKIRYHLVNTGAEWVAYSLLEEFYPNSEEICKYLAEKAHR